MEERRALRHNRRFDASVLTAQHEEPNALPMLLRGPARGLLAVEWVVPSMLVRGGSVPSSVPLLHWMIHRAQQQCRPRSMLQLVNSCAAYACNKFEVCHGP